MRTHVKLLAWTHIVFSTIPTSIALSILALYAGGYFGLLSRSAGTPTLLLAFSALGTQEFVILAVMALLGYRNL